MISRTGLLLAVLAALALPAGAAAADKPKQTTADKKKKAPADTQKPPAEKQKPPAEKQKSAAAEKPAAASEQPPAAAPKPPRVVEKPKPLTPEKHKLKKGAEGQLCFGCHVQLEAQLKKASVHTPVRSKQCVGCHNPHSSQHGKLLANEIGATCLSCHGEVVPAKAHSTHAPAANGECVKCHAAHASDNPFVLTKPITQLCAGCHEGIVKGAAAAKVKHRPVEQGGCATCHDPHGSKTAPLLLTSAEPDLCLRCHKADKPIFAKQHGGYVVSRARCTSCHDPHGSSVKGMLYDNVHAPVAKGMCGQCHEAPGAQAGFAPKQHARELCNRCHARTVTAITDKGHLHRPVMEGDACLNCHDPHASKQKKLLVGPTSALCGSCHEDTSKRHERSPTKHQPIGDGECFTCHDPHSSDSPLLFAKAAVVDTCGQCHDFKKHQTHPIGEKVADPRNRNLTVECLSCHRAHGTEFKRLMPFAQAPDLCVKCHQQYKR
jgi:predicted CXXCH cytochrome family protein